MSRLAKHGLSDGPFVRPAPDSHIRSRGVPTALTGHEVLSGDDPAKVSALLARLLGANHLVIHPPTEGFHATVNAIRLRDVTMAYLDVQAAVTFDIPVTHDLYSVHMPLNGSAECSYNGVRVEASPFEALVVNPGTDLQMTMQPQSPQLIIRIETRALQSQFARMLGHGIDTAVDFAPIMPLTSGAANRWQGAVQLLSSEVMTPDSLIQQGVGAGPLEELIISSLLWVHESTHHHDLLEASHAGGRRAVRQSVTFIEENLASPLTLEDLASHAHVSVRSIQQGFHDDLGTTPMTYLRDRRLDRARGELSDAILTDGISVTQVAEHWGFGHLGNFSSMYRKRFGETPSQTLRR
ncbi:helix-turn-helix domain-containing protein [Aeromicrobium sp.]|uniref:AraC-like ligand-binding domain-containing protein n=1 Tax=Aeromicrobium sp. TaxID=1871063 RepID=UPI0019A0DC57|nr:helix-turn-helix domain-containing protein [Aeromicrobium sp.]MBC7631848.1 helix-turn-helix domain-containing protein [Aeromicrobium sp.]